jgi:hypothetical protein
MSDYKSSLPVRSEADIDERLQSKLVDFTDPSNGATIADNKLWVKSHLNDQDGNPYTEENPLPVYSAESPGAEVDEYDVAVALAKDASANHDYTVTASTSLKEVEVRCSASGRAKFELQIETAASAGTFASSDVAFNSTANPNCTLKHKTKVAEGVIVRVIKTNLDNQAQDVYSKIMGIEI